MSEYRKGEFVEFEAPAWDPGQTMGVVLRRPTERERMELFGVDGPAEEPEYVVNVGNVIGERYEALFRGSELRPA